MEKETPLLLTAKQAAKFCGYGTERRFRLAVARGKLPEPFDGDARPRLWSRDEILNRLGRAPARDEDSWGVKQLDRALGLAPLEK